MQQKLSVLLFMLCCRLAVTAQAALCYPSAPASVFLDGAATEKLWMMQRADSAGRDGAAISSPQFNTAGWLPAIVPGTVLTSLVANHIYPDPYYGDVNKRSRHLIPDMADSGREFYHYWYRRTFTLPATLAGHKRVWLKFHGVNYRAAIWLNGQAVGNIAGMFNPQVFDITAIINRKTNNILAVDVQPVDVPGQSGLKKEKRTGAAGENHNGGDGLIGENVTMLMSAGWDFTFADGIRDRNTGIWREVELFATGDVLLEDAFVQSTLPLPDTASARETVSVSVYNAAAVPQTGIVTGTVKEAGISFQQTVTLAPGERKQVVFSPADYSQLVMHHPKLWWPVNKGAQHLYTLDITFVQNRKVTHAVSARFGIREITSDQHTPDSSRRFLVNGHPVFIRGSNWIPEAMQRNSVQRTKAGLLYTRQAGINLLRLWGGGIAESDYFFRLCDELGILVWAEFWITGDTRMPSDTALYLLNLEKTVQRIRNHASLAYYVSSNESTEVPGAAALIHRLDSTRGYQVQSECCGVHDGSPYKYENPMQYFENTASARGSRVDGFNPEYGTPCLPLAESLRQMMPEKDLWPVNDTVWNYLDGGGFHQVTTKYRQAVDQWGAAASLEAFAQKAQLVGAMNYRAIWEVWNYNKFRYGHRFASGFLFWYHNSPVPQVCARLYDWYLQPTAALYYSQNALQPLHPQFDYLQNTVSVYNDFRKTFRHYSVTAEVYDINSKKQWSESAVIDIPADGVVNDIFKIDFPDSISQVHFIKLTLADADGHQVSDAFYWRSRDAYKGAWTLTGPAISGFETISRLKPVTVTAVARKKNGFIELEIKNPADGLAFFTQVKVQHPGGKLISPVFCSDNFFSLLPGESRVVTIQSDDAAFHSGKFNLVINGINVSATTIISSQIK